jgi:hypothetical protein
MHLVRVGQTSLRLTLSIEEAAHLQEGLAALLRVAPLAPSVQLARAPRATCRRLVQQLARALVQTPTGRDADGA